MIEPDADYGKLEQKLHAVRRRSRWTIIGERLIRHFWRIALWLMLFASLWLMDTPSHLGKFSEIITVIGFYGGLLYFFIKDAWNFHFPSPGEIDHRIEQESGLAHRPLTSFEDTLANPLRLPSRTLWDIRRQKLSVLLENTRPVSRHPFLSTADPYAVRFAVVFMFVLGLVIAGPDWNTRLMHGLMPFSLQGLNGPDQGIRLVITPPPYTSKSQIIIAKSSRDLKIPTGSTLKFSVNDGFGRPFLVADNVAFPFEKARTGNYFLEMTAPQAKKLSLRQTFITRADWTYSLVPDNPPVLNIKEKPEIMPDGTIRFHLSLKDDYGVKTLSMRMSMPDGQTLPVTGHERTVTRSVLSAPDTTLDMEPVYDLTSHPWAGMPVKITLEADDQLHQKSPPQIITMSLPERHFTQPAARMIIALRKHLLYAPLAEYQALIEQVETLVSHPDNFRYDLVTALALRSAASRLYWAGPSIDTAESVAALLWDTALRIEDGNVSIAARAMRDARQALENALRDPKTSPQDISQLMQNFRMAMAQYLMEVQREIQKRVAQGESIPMLSPDMLSAVINPEDLANFLNEMEARMASGDRQAAEKMLSQLNNMMEQTTLSKAELPEDVKQMMESSKALQKLIQRQQSLLDRTQMAQGQNAGNPVQTYGKILPRDEKLFRHWGLEDVPPQPDLPKKDSQIQPSATREGQKEQESLRYDLGQIMLKAAEASGSIPENMGKAEQEMRASSGALQNNAPNLSIPHQQEVLKQLNQARQQMGEALIRRLQNMTGLALGGSGMKYDPLGRPYGGYGNGNGPFQGSTVKIPDEAERKQAQEILKLIQQRSGEFDRPDQELEYYKRLLKQF